MAAVTGFRSTDDHSKQIHMQISLFFTKLNLVHKRRNFDEMKFTKEDVHENVDQAGFSEGNRQKSFLCRLLRNVSKTLLKQMVHFSCVYTVVFFKGVYNLSELAG